MPDDSIMSFIYDVSSFGLFSKLPFQGSATLANTRKSYCTVKTGVSGQPFKIGISKQNFSF